MGILDESAIAEVEPTPKIQLLEDAHHNLMDHVTAWIVGYREAELPTATGSKPSQPRVCSSLVQDRSGFFRDWPCRSRASQLQVARHFYSGHAKIRALCELLHLQELPSEAALRSDRRSRPTVGEFTSTWELVMVEVPTIGHPASLPVCLLPLMPTLPP